MISLLVCSRISGNKNWGLPQLLEGLEKGSADHKNFELLVKFDTDDEEVADFLPKLDQYSFQIKYLIEPRGRGYIDIHIGYTRLMSIADPRSTVMGAFADDFVMTVERWDALVLEKTTQFKDDIYMIHQRPHPPYYREDYDDNPAYFDYGLDQLDFIEIIDEGPFWSRRLLEICGGLGHISFTDAWTLALEWYLFHNHGLNRTLFLEQPVIHRVLHEDIDTRGSDRWSTDRMFNFDFMKGEFYRKIVKEQANNLYLNIVADEMQLPKSKQDPYHSPVEKLLGTATRSLTSALPETSVREFQRIVDEYPDMGKAYEGLGVALAKMGKLDSAESALNKGLGLCETPSEHSWNSLGIIAFQRGSLEKAEVSFKKERDLFPENIDAWVNLVRVLIRLDRFKEAVTQIGLLAAKAPNYQGVAETIVELKTKMAAHKTGSSVV